MIYLTFDFDQSMDTTKETIEQMADILAVHLNKLNSKLQIPTKDKLIQILDKIYELSVDEDPSLECEEKEVSEQPSSAIDKWVSVEPGYIHCSFCGRVWDGFAQCPCLEEEPEFFYRGRCSQCNNEIAAGVQCACKSDYEF